MYVCLARCFAERKRRRKEQQSHNNQFNRFFESQPKDSFCKQYVLIPPSLIKPLLYKKTANNFEGKRTF